MKITAKPIQDTATTVRPGVLVVLFDNEGCARGAVDAALFCAYAGYGRDDAEAEAYQRLCDGLGVTFEITPVERKHA